MEVEVGAVFGQHAHYEHALPRLSPSPHPPPSYPSADLSFMGRSVPKSVARIYANVNQTLGPQWHEYGALTTMN